ncbi:Zn-dependent protease with chaperone function-like protein [Leptolyngbya sp. NIES-3755]|nr:Zn-dependent protease with chaperone function-like protein [Leptolyngbya sp. NIES-3755]
MRVALLAVLGYGYIFLILAGLLVGVWLVVTLAMSVRRVNSVIVQLFFLLLVPAWMIARSLWVTFSPPEGLRLDRQKVPQMFALVDELTTKLDAPKFHNILLTPDFNMAVMQVPRLGIFGWQENYLIVGLPILQGLTLDQVKAVLAHEIGHLSGNHSRFGGWIYRIRKTWFQLYDRIHQSDRQGVSVLFDRFLSWYFPTFNAYSFVLARMNEYDADRCAAELAGKQNVADVLTNVELKSRFLDREFWAGIYQGVEDQPDPPANAYSLMLTKLKGTVPPEKSDQWIQEALSEQTTNEDTHPCFRDRLKALGFDRPPIEPAPVEVSAAEILLGDTVNEFVAEFNRSWREAQATPWRQRYAHLSEVKAKLEALEEKTELSDDEVWKKAYYVLELRGNEAAMPDLKEVLVRQPDHVAANFTLGEALLRQGDAAGVECIEKAIAQQFNLVIDGCKLIHDFYVQQDQIEQANHYRDKAEQHYELMQKAEQERESISIHDQLKPHTLTTEEIDSLRQQLQTYSDIKEAYLAEKVVNYLPEARFCFLGIVRKQGLLDSKDAAQKLFSQVVEQVEFPTEVYIIVFEGNEFKEKIASVEQSLILQQ